jgi:hypothetical protein
MRLQKVSQPEQCGEAVGQDGRIKLEIDFFPIILGLVGLNVIDLKSLTRRCGGTPSPCGWSCRWLGLSEHAGGYEKSRSCRRYRSSDHEFLLNLRTTSSISEPQQSSVEPRIHRKTDCILKNLKDPWIYFHIIAP